MSTTLFAIVFKDTGEIITEDKIREVWPNYGHSSYRVSKKVYFTIGTAKSGFTHLPDKLKPSLKIQEFGPAGQSFDGQDLMEEADRKLEKRKAADARRLARIRAEEQRHREEMAKITKGKR